MIKPICFSLQNGCLHQLLEAIALKSIFIDDYQMCSFNQVKSFYSIEQMNYFHISTLLKVIEELYLFEFSPALTD